MIKLTNGIEAKNFITKELSQKLGSDKINTVMNIDYCSLPPTDLKEYFKACYEDVFFPYRNYCAIYSYSFIEDSEDTQIEKMIYEINKHSDYKKPILFITTLSKEKLDELNIEKRKEDISILNIDKYEIKKIPNKIEKLISLFIISIPLQYWIYKHAETILYFLEKNKESFIDFFKIICIFIINLSSLFLLFIFIYWIFKAFALHIKGLLTLTTICIFMTLILLWNFNNIFQFTFLSFIITFIPLFVMKEGFDSNFKIKIIESKNNFIWDPITYFKNKNKKE